MMVKDFKPKELDLPSIDQTSLPLISQVLYNPYVFSTSPQI